MIEKIKNIIFKKRPASKETIFELLCWVLSCWLISVGVCLIIDSHLGLQIGIKPILWQTLLAVVASFLLTRRWWIPVIYFGVLVPVFFLAISLSGDIFGFFDSFASFVKWWAASMPYNSKWYSDQGFYMVHTFINIGVGILFFAVARITKRAWTVVALAFAFIVVNYVKGYTGYDTWAIPFLLAGIFPLIAGEKFHKSKLYEDKNHFGLWGKKWFFVVVSTFMAIVVSAMSFAVVSTIDGSVRTRLCSDIVADIQTATDTFTKEQKKLNVTLFDLGLVTNSTYIGGDLYNIESEVIATTNLTETALIKLTSFDTFNGKNWVTDFKKGYRINGIWQERQNSYLSSPMINDELFLSYTNEAAFKTKVNITMSRDANYLFTMGQVLNFSENTPTENPILFDELGRIVSYYGQKKGYSYSFEALIYDTSEKVLKRQINNIMTDFPERKDTFYNENSELYAPYKEKFSDARKEIEAAIKGMNFDGENKYEKAYKICKYFSEDNGFIYTEEPPKFKKSDNIVEKLLKTKKGHCLYYSTAMIALAREEGIPSRLAAGYRTVESQDGKTQVIDRSSPYVWVECYIPNIGWMSFDPSPAKENVSHQGGGGGTESKDGDFEAPDINVDAEFEKNSEPQRRIIIDEYEILVNIVSILLISFMVLILICLILNTLFSQKAYEIEFVRKRFGSTKQQAEFYYQDILRQFSWLGYRFKKGETISELTLRASGSFTDDVEAMVISGIKIIEALHYGDITPADDDVNAVFEARMVLEKVLQEKNNTVSYVIKRQLLLPVFDFKAKKYI